MKDRARSARQRTEIYDWIPRFVRSRSRSRRSSFYQTENRHFIMLEIGSGVSRCMIAGARRENAGFNFVFQEDGQAHFPGKQTFDYKVGHGHNHEQLITFMAIEVKSTWAVVTNPNGVTLYDVDLSGNDLEVGVVSTKPRWQLKQMTSDPCPSAESIVCPRSNRSTS